MADSIEQRIIDRVVAAMQTIDGTGDFETEIGARVEDSRPNWDEAELPAISVFSGKVTSDDVDAEGTQVIRTMNVMIDCGLKRLDTAGDDAAFARHAMGDIYAAIASDPLWRDEDGQPLAIRTTEMSHATVYTETTHEITGVQVEIEIRYESQAFNMYA